MGICEAGEIPHCLLGRELTVKMATVLVIVAVRVAVFLSVLLQGIVVPIIVA